MDWSPIIAGGVTGLLSGAVSGNLIQYVLDKKRIKHRRRLEFIEYWREILNTQPLIYSDIIENSSYEILEELISLQVANKLRQIAIKANETKRRLNLEFEAWGEYECNLGLSDLYENASDEEILNLPPLEDPVGDLEKDTTNQFVNHLRRELRRLEKKWGLL